MTTKYERAREYCAARLGNGRRCQNLVKLGQGPCWRHSKGLWSRVRSFARNDTKKFVLTTAIGLGSILAALYGGAHLSFIRTVGQNSPAILGNGNVITYGISDTARPWVAIKDPTLTDVVTLSDRGFDASVRLPLENTSETPALAAVDASLFFVTDHHPEVGIEKAQDDLCRRIQNRMESGGMITSTVFRGNDRSPMTVLVHADTRETDAATRLMTSNFMPPGSPPEIYPVILSCVVYRTTPGKEFFSTAYANMIGRLICQKTPGKACGVGPMFARRRRYLAAELAFPPMFEPPTRAK